MGACTTMVVDFSSHDAGQAPEAPGGAATDAPLADVAGPQTAPDASLVDPHEVTANLEDQFQGMLPLPGPSRYVVYKCCDDIAMNCAVWKQGNDSTCRDTTTWTTAATADCTSRGLRTAGIGLFVGC
jgi:hypothetical protein